MTRKLCSLLACVAVLGSVSACGGSDAPARPSVVTAGDASAVQAAGNAGRAFVYVTLTADADDRLMSATVPDTIAASAVVSPGVSTGDPAGGHLGHLDGDGAPEQGPSWTGLEMTANTPLTLAPGAARIVIDGLVRPLQPGDRITIGLSFRSGATLDIEAEVRPIAP